MAASSDLTSIAGIVKHALIGKIVKVEGYETSGKVENVEFYDQFEYWVLELEGDKTFSAYHDDLIEIVDGS
jgi:hypothetical protein